MPARRLLFLDASRLTAFHWRHGRLEAEGEFLPDTAGLEAYADYIRRHRTSLFSMVVDVAEEGFQIEDIPAVQGADRSALLKRKLGQYFYGTPFATALSLGRQPGGRRDERILFTALTRPQHIEPWLTALAGQEAQLAGIHPLPLLVAALLPGLGQPPPQLLVITVTRGGLRQTFFENGQLRFSRLTVLATHSSQESALACAAESAKIYQYLLAQRLLTRGQVLPVRVLAHPGQLSAFRDCCRDSDALSFDFANLATLAGKLGLRSLPQDSKSELLFLHQAVRKPPAQQLAPAEARHFFRLGQVRVGLRAAGLVALAGCLLFAGHNALTYRELDEATTRIRAQTAQDNQRYAAILADLPKVSLSNDALRAVIDRYDEVAKRALGPEPALVQLSQALTKSPRIELVRLEWWVASNPSQRPPGIAPTTVATASATPAPTPAGTARGAYAITELQAQLPVAMVSDHRAQLEAIEGFANALRADKALQVQVFSLPFEVESSKSIKSGAATQIEAPKFSLRVTRRL